MKRSTILRCAASATVMAMAAGSASAVYAQDSTPTGGASVEEVIVTGSRVANGVDAPSPVTVVTATQITQANLPSRVRLQQLWAAAMGSSQSSSRLALSSSSRGCPPPWGRSCSCCSTTVMTTAAAAIWPCSLPRPTSP